MYIGSAIIVSTILKQTSSSPLLSGGLDGLLCPDTGILDKFNQPASLLCSCFPPQGTGTSTTTTTLITDGPLATETETTTVEAPTSTATETETDTVTTTVETTTTLIPDAVTVVIPTTVTTTTLTCFTTGGVQVFVPPVLKKRDGARGGDGRGDFGRSSSMQKGSWSPSSSAKVSTSAKWSTTTKSSSMTKAPTKTGNAVCAAVTGERGISRAISSVCSCISAIPAITTTTVGTTSTSTNAPLTTTVTDTALTTPSTTVTDAVTATETATDTIIEIGEIPTILVTNTINVATSSPTGIPYYYYQPLNPALTDNPPFDNTINSLRNNLNYQGAAVIQNPNVIDGATPINFPGIGSRSGVQFGMVFQGYLFAADGPGQYTITSRAGLIDNIGVVWNGDKAYGNNWNAQNADYIASYPGSGQVTITLLANEARPITFMVLNGAITTGTDFVITNPAGQLIENPSRFLYADCGANFIP